MCLSVLLAFQGFGFALPAYAATETTDAAASEQNASVEPEGDAADTAGDAESDAESDAEDAEGAADGEGLSSGDESISSNASNQGEPSDDSDSDAVVLADVASGSYTFSTLEELNESLKSGKHGSVSSAGLIMFSDSVGLKMISNASPELYENATLQLDGATGAGISLCAVDGEAYPFQGFGSEEYPFAGKIVDSSGKSLQVKADCTVYNARKLTSENGEVKIIWQGALDYCEPMVAAVLSGEGTLDAQVEIDDPSNADDIAESSAALTAPLIGISNAASVTVNAAYSFAGTRRALGISASGNIGLLANKVAGGSFAIGSVAGLDGVSGDDAIATSNGNAGMFIGEVSDGASVSMGAYTLPINTTVTSGGGCAGGLAGLVGSGCTVSLTGAVDFTKLTVQGTTASGGLIGKATKLTLNQDSGAVFTCPATVGSVTSENTGGFIGSVSFNGEKTFAGNNEVVTASAVNLKGKTNAGAAFGYLDIANGNVAFNGPTDSAASFKSALAENGGSVVYGCIVGRVEDTSATQIDNTYYASIHTLTMNNVSVEGTCTKQAKTAGGLVGSLGSGNTTCATLIVDDATVAWGGPWVSTSFGGVVGCVDRYSVLDCGSVTVSSTSEVSKGAGIVGETWVGTIHLRGTTDLSGLRLSASGYVGQIANTSAASPSLVFAEGSGSDTESGSGWTFKRPAAVAVDDLGGASGGGSLLGNNEVVRLGSGELSSGLIKLDDTTHQPRFWLSENSTNVATEVSDSKGYSWGRQLAYSSSSNTVSVASADEFACLALTIQTRGYFSGVSGIGNSSVSKLSSATVNIAGDINLAGSGLTGLSQDVYTTNFTWAFTGTLNGGDHTVALAVGEPYGMRGDTKIEPNDTTEGNGKIYYHNRLGLLGEIAGATVNNLTIAGSMNFDAKTSIDAAALAARVKGGANVVAASSDVTSAVAISFDSSTNASGLACVGGLFGRVSAASSIALGGTGKVGFTGKIASSVEETGNSNVGGIIGRVDDAVTTVAVSNVAIGGSITTADSNRYTGVGGFIGVISQGKSTKNVNITGLDLGGLSITRGGNDKTSSAGGLLGHSWGSTNVSFTGSASSYALKTSNTTLAANSATKVGGLVYAASGVWTVEDYAIDLSGVTINASSATKLGLLVCMGGSNVTVGGNAGFKETLSGLYLKNTANWETAYKVNESDGAISAEKATTFDEWIADTCKPDSSVTDSGVNGVVSLKTAGSVLDMSGQSNSRNSYENRTALGKSKQTNGSSRYYYNLDGMASDGDGSVDSPGELLLWSVYRYAADGIRSNFEIGDYSATTISGALDMAGYSYYPVDVTGENVTLQNATITFYNNEIESEETGNKLTSAATQHANMHAGLLRNFSCGTTSATYTVNGVTLKGSVGMDAVANTSGALLCGTMVGTSTSSAIAKLDITNLALDGLVIRGVDANTSLAPLIACNLGTYTALDVVGITASGYANGTEAATSLFGNLGGEDAEQVTASFTNVAVPSLNSGDGKNAIFTHASLLESYSYEQGKASSATYTFTQQDQTNNRVTFGSEIDSNGEYSGKQLWYYDESLNGTNEGLVNDGTRTADESDPAYGVYLPYVAKGKSGTAYHELKVNQRIANLIVGCGTYGDPYKITKAAELYAIANYINSGAAQDGWVVTIAVNQETICTRRSTDGATDNEVTYQYNASTSNWQKGTYADGVWTADASGATLENSTMRRYVQSCYLSIESTNLEVDAAAFSGLGNHDYPFRGVVVGDLTGSSSNATIVINNSADTHIKGLIPYSYGSVVRNLSIQYKGVSNTIEYTAKNSDDGVPNAFFGGVIGCIMGGDNIIDGVAVSAGEASASAASETNGNALAALWTALASAAAGSDVAAVSATGGNFDVSATGTSPHLVAIGGYVGAIAGGGVIFRNVSGDSWHASGANLYDNPYVGRVIDGFAFSEGCTVNNGDDNYKVNELEDAGTACVTTSDIQNKYREGSTNTAATVAVSNAQGLLILSAIISSGAASGACHTTWLGDSEGVFIGSRAYQGYKEGTIPTTGYRFGNTEYGKVRNSDYSTVGNASSDDANFTKSVADDLKAPGMNYPEAAGPLNHLEEEASKQYMNSPYLVAKYADQETGYVCASKLSGINLQFADGATYDMTGYGAGFTGLSGRYYSNACYSGNKSNDRDRIIPWVACINGNNATLTLTSAVKEYADDDYSVAGVGGLFSTITFTSNYVGDSISANGASVKDVTFKNCNVSLTYLDSSNNAATDYAKGNTGVGILAGATANANSQASYGVYKNVVITGDSGQTTTVVGGENAGGLIGSAGYGSRSASDSVDEIISYGGQCAPIKLYDCSYSNLSVTGRTNVGGFAGKIASGESGVWATGANDLALASSSTIAIDSSSTDNANVAGGIFGLVGCAVNVNTGQDSSATQLAVVSDVKVTTECAASKADEGCTRGVGSLVGRTEGAVVANRLKVTATAEASSDSPIYLGSIEGTRNNSSNTAVKNVGGIVGWSNRNVSINGSTVEKLRIGAGEHSGGIVGTLDSGVTLSVDGSTVSALVLDGARMGGVVGNVDNSGANVVVLNSQIQACSFSGIASYWRSHPGGNGNFSGGIVGYALGTYKVSNVLLSENTFADTAKRQGLLVGCTASSSSDFKGLYAAGIDVKLASGQTNSDVPAAICYFNENNGDKATINKKSYIAFADYGDSFDGTTGSELYNATDAAGVAAVSPYVTTSPKSTVSVKASSDASAQALFGNGAAIATAATIQGEAGASVDGRYTYTNIGGIDGDGSYRNSNDYNATNSASTFNANNTTSTVESDFPVLLLSGNDTTTVANYLDLVTNGGFSDAVRLNGSTKHVTAAVQTVKLVDGSLVADSSTTPTVRVLNNGASSMAFRATSQWDNEKGQFTLLTVTFSEAGQTYSVQVPIVVKRMLEVDFTATYSYGTHFTPSDYESLGFNSHVLSNFGEPMTGYLTWTYNQAKGTPTEYGWDTHLASGASMAALEKTIVFDGSNGAGTLPAGTQLTLVDTAHNDRAYSYTVGEGGATSVKLTDFVDSDNNNYAEQWLSEIMGVSAASDSAGAWVRCDAQDSNVGAKVVDGDETTYYRPYAQGDTGDRFTLSVAKGEDGKETSPSENFYLTVNVPAGATELAVNGYTITSFGDTAINKTINCTLRSNKAVADSHENTASTYSIYSSYGQTLVDDDSSTAISVVSRSSDGVGYTFPVSATDTIAFDSSQQYNDTDKLYYQFSASLVSYDSAGSTSAVGFPTGAAGTLNFYVKVGETYYTPSLASDGTTAWSAASSTPTAAVSKEWSADGSDLSEPLSGADGVPYDLSGIRKLAKDHGNTFSITAEVANFKMTEEACKKAIVASQDGKSYTKVNYRSALSTRTDTLGTSSMIANAVGNPGYYRQDLGTSTIELDASKQSQLGINVDDLSLADGTIAAVGTYSLLKLADGASAIDAAAAVRYTLSLQRRTGTDGTYSNVNIADYLDVTESALGVGVASGDRSAIAFTDSKSADGAFATRDGDTNCFKFLFQVKVNTDIETAGQGYANYRIVLTATLVDASGNEVDEPINALGAAGYDHSDYITYSLTRVNVQGIPHSS